MLNHLHLKKVKKSHIQLAVYLKNHNNPTNKVNNLYKKVKKIVQELMINR